MKKTTVEELAYSILEAQKNEKPAPIFFLGAGASVTGGMPLASKIAKDILDSHETKPSIQELPDKEKTYPKLMDCLLPDERRDILAKYIQEAKVNVAHIYLAQLFTENFADYILTVNFDDLLLRALALYNQFPPTHDIATLKALTTTIFSPRSILYLHGRINGLRMLNTEEEMREMKETAEAIFNGIKNQRPWIFIGYSGSDPMFEYVKNLKNFDNGLYWVAHKQDLPEPKIQKFLSDNQNAFLIQDYDADAFMLELNNKLHLEQPPILDRPFSLLGEMLDDIVDIRDETHFTGVKERLEIAKRNVARAEELFENTTGEASDTIKTEHLNKEITDWLLTSVKEEQISEIEKRVKEIGNETSQRLLSYLYFSRGNDLYDSAKSKTGEEAEELYLRACEKYEKATKIKPDLHETFNNWGAALNNLARLKTGEEAKKFYLRACEKYEKAIQIKPEGHKAFYNWGNALNNLAQLTTGEEAKKLILQAIEKGKKSVELGGGCYNLACAYAMHGDRENALSVLNDALEKQGVSTDFVRKDEDWRSFLPDEEFQAILKKLDPDSK